MNVLPFTVAVYRAQAAGNGLPRASAAVADEGASRTSETPFLPTRKVETVAGTEAKDGELNPVTVVCSHSAGRTVTPLSEVLVALTCAREPYAPDSTGAAGDRPLSLVSSAPRSWAAVKLTAGTLVPGAVAL